MLGVYEAYLCPRAVLCCAELGWAELCYFMLWVESKLDYEKREVRDREKGFR